MESKPEKLVSFQRHVVFLEQTRIVSGFHVTECFFARWHCFVHSQNSTACCNTVGSTVLVTWRLSCVNSKFEPTVLFAIVPTALFSNDVPTIGVHVFGTGETINDTTTMFTNFVTRLFRLFISSCLNNMLYHV